MTTISLPSAIPPSIVIGKFFKGALKDPQGHKVSGAHLVVGAPAPAPTLREFSLRPYTPPVGNQRSSSRCTGWGYGRSVQTTRYKHESDTFVLSPGGIYTLGRCVDRSSPLQALEDNGAEPNQVERAMIEYGIPREMDWPTLDTNVNAEPSGPQLQHAATVHAGSFYHISESPDLDFEGFRNRLCQVLAAGIAPAFYCEVDDSHENYDGRGVLSVPGKSLGGHEICCTGWKDYGNIIEWAGSWGEEWGLAGYGYGDEGFIRSAAGFAFVRPS